MDILNELQELKFELDLTDYYQEDQTADELIEAVREGIFQEEIIYYSRAMEYLSRNDASLNQSLELADEMGYTTIGLNSEVLATLLYQQDLLDQLAYIEDEIQDIFEAVES